MSLELSNTEILERAAEIRAREDESKLRSAEDSKILFHADRIAEQRERGGFSGVLEKLANNFRSERQQAEATIQRALKAEKDLEDLLWQESAIDVAIQREKGGLVTLQELQRDFAELTTPAAETAKMLSRWDHRHDPRFREHLQFAVKGIMENRLIAEAMPMHIEKSRQELDRLIAEKKELTRKISKVGR